MRGWRWRWRCYLACDPDEEVDHRVRMLFLNRLGEHRLRAWHRLAAAKHLKYTRRRIQLTCQGFLFVFFLFENLAKKDSTTREDLKFG